MPPCIRNYAKLYQHIVYIYLYLYQYRCLNVFIYLYLDIYQVVHLSLYVALKIGYDLQKFIAIFAQLHISYAFHIRHIP